MILANFLKTIKALVPDFDVSKKDAIRQDKILLDFKNQRPLYEAFSLVMRKMVEALLIQGGYKYQLSVRIKDIQKLEEKIKRKSNLGLGYKKLSDIEDLAGLRIIFYTEVDKEAFIGELKNEIAGHVLVENLEKSSGYTATHIIARLSRKRLKLVEYESFWGLKCEIQITSAIYHAWSELEHDLIYKDVNGLEKFNPDKYKLAKAKLGDILEKYIKKAVVEFEEVMKEMNIPKS